MVINSEIDQVNSDIDALETDLTTIETDMQLEDISDMFIAVPTYTASVKAYRSGKVVMVFGVVTKDLPSGSVGNIANIVTINDSRYYPIYYSPGCDATSGATADLPIKINIFADPVGVIKAMVPVPLAAVKRFMVSYMIA